MNSLYWNCIEFEMPAFQLEIYKMVLGNKNWEGELHKICKHIVNLNWRIVTNYKI